MDDDDRPVALDAYETIAEAYAARIDTKEYNSLIERPTTLSLLPDVSGMYVLDAGCGPGVYSEWLVNHGATVVALDASPKMVELARKRLGTKVEIHRANLERPLTFLNDAFFDLVISPLVPDYILNWDSYFRELARVLKEDGIVVFSVEHPFTKFVIGGTTNYFQTERIHEHWKGFGTPVDMPSYRRPLNAMIEPLLRSGFVIESIVEALPTEECRLKNPEIYQKTSQSPTFLSFRVRKSAKQKSYVQ